MDNNYISITNLFSVIDGYLKGQKQDKPLIVWCDMPKYMHKTFPSYPIPYSLARRLGDFKGIIFFSSPTLKVSQVHFSEIMDSDNFKKDIKVVILTPELNSYNEGEMQYGMDIYKKFGKAVVFLMLMEYRDRIKEENLEGCDQVICVDDDSALLKDKNSK